MPTSPTVFSLGTVTVTNGSTAVTFAGAGLVVNGVAGGILFVGDSSMPLASVESDTAATLARPWAGASAAGASYAISLESSLAADATFVHSRLVSVLGAIGAIENARPNYEVQSLGANVPPGAPVAGGLYVVGTVPTGAWAGRANNLGQWTGAAWLFTAPERGTTVVSAATGIISIWNGTGWAPYVAPSTYFGSLMPSTSVGALLTALGFSPFIQGMRDDVDQEAARATLGALGKGGDTMDGRLIAAGGGQADNGIANASVAGGEVEIRGNGTGAAAILLHRPGAFAAYLGLDTDNQWKVGGGSHGAVAYKIYHAASVVGAVSQAGGVPTGAIVERGTNANGDYVRYADGTQICWRRHVRAPGNLASYAFADAGAYTFPIAFLGGTQPVVTNSYDGAWSPFVYTSVTGVTAVGINNVYFTNVSNSARDTTGGSPTFHYHAIGRWY